MKDYKQGYRLLLAELERLGGDLRGVSSLYSIENEAKVRRLIRERVSPSGNYDAGKGNEVRATLEEGTRSESHGHIKLAPAEERAAEAISGDLIADYPVVLHPIYRAKREAWLQACSLKMSLNALAREEEVRAVTLQRELWKLFEAMDRYDMVLNHWKKHKVVIEADKEDYSGLSAVELVQRRNTLRSNIVSREKTLKKLKVCSEAGSTRGQISSQKKQPLEVDTEEVSSREAFLLQEKIYKKENELVQLRLQVKAIEAMING